MKTPSTFTREELLDIGLAEFGTDVAVDRSVRFFGAERIRLGSHVRIDAYSVLSSGAKSLTIGNYVHVAVGVRFLGGEQVIVEDFCGLSSGACIFGSNDDYSDGALTNPTVPQKYTNVTVGSVLLRKHAIIGANSVILPNVTIGLASSVGALTFVNKSVPDFAIVSGNPMRRIGRRDPSVLDHERRFLEEAARPTQCGEAS